MKKILVQGSVFNPFLKLNFRVPLPITFIKYLQVENISKSDIGIVTPYKRQEMEIHSRLVNLDINSRTNKFRNGKSHGIEVGSVEKFQGNEKKIMIISTVKSR